MTLTYTYDFEGVLYKEVTVTCTGQIEIETNKEQGEGVEIEIDTPVFMYADDYTMYVYDPDHLKQFLLDHFNEELSTDKDLNKAVKNQLFEETETDLREVEIYKD